LHSICLDPKFLIDASRRAVLPMNTVVAHLKSLTSASVVVGLGLNFALAGEVEPADYPQLSPEMLSPNPLGPAQTLKYPASIDRTAPGRPSPVVPPRALPTLSRSTPPLRSNPTKQALATVRRPLRGLAAPLNIVPVKTVHNSRYELPPMSYSATPPRLQYCTSAFRDFMSPRELEACGWLPHDARSGASSSDDAIY
jgi:hypothetical protein